MSSGRNIWLENSSLLSSPRFPPSFPSSSSPFSSLPLSCSFHPQETCFSCRHAGGPSNPACGRSSSMLCLFELSVPFSEVPPCCRIIGAGENLIRTGTWYYRETWSRGGGSPLGERARPLPLGTTMGPCWVGTCTSKVAPSLALLAGTGWQSSRPLSKYEIHA